MQLSRSLNRYPPKMERKDSKVLKKSTRYVLEHNNIVTDTHDSPQVSQTFICHTHTLQSYSGEGEMRVTINPLKEIINARSFMIHIDDKKYKLDTGMSTHTKRIAVNILIFVFIDAESLEKLCAIIKQKYNLSYNFDLEYFDNDFGEFGKLMLCLTTLPHYCY